MFLNDFEYIDGFQFQASHFADVKSNWGIGFTIWKSGESEDKENFKIDICDIDRDSQTRDIEIIDNKDIYNVDNHKTCSVWIREDVKNIKTDIAPEFTSGIKIRTTPGTKQGKMVKGALGYFFCGSNNVETNTQNVGLFTSAMSINIGISILPINFDRCISFFSARKLIIADWINSKDEYFAPDESNPDFEEFVNDSVVFSLFHSASN